MPSPTTTTTTRANDDVAIAGAGATGLAVADRLRALGLHCRVCETGPLDLDVPATASAVERRALRHEPAGAGLHAFRTAGLPAEWRRIRAAGGRTWLWGGWCHRFSPQALADGDLRTTPWPLTWDELAQRYRRVERRWQVRSQPVVPVLQAAAAELGLKAVAKRRASTGDRPRLALDLLRTQACIEPDRTALDVMRDAAGQACGLLCGDRRGRMHEVPARAVVLCLSAVETCRLLLASGVRDRIEHGDQLGRSLTDHQVLSWLALAPGPVTQEPGAMFVPRFVNLGPAPDRDYIGGFCLELLGPLPAATLGPERLTLLGLDAVSAQDQHAYVVHALGDSPANPGRFVALDPVARDPLGRPLPVLHLGWSDADRAMARDMQETGLALCDALLPDGGRVVPLTEPFACGGPTHEGGGCAIGWRDTPADPWGEVRGVPGLFVADTSAMPSAGDAHPTLTALALAQRVADRVVARLA